MERGIRNRFNRLWQLQGECWIWQDAPSHGYGKMRIGRKQLMAHRVSWVLHRGRIPRGMCVLHKCDTPLCVNPDHLFLGTRSDNIADRHRKGRDARGARNTSTKLTEGEVRAIRADKESGSLELARKYGVNHYVIFCIKHGKTWSWLD